MRLILRAAILLALPAAGLAQQNAIPIPAGVRMDGVPPIPAAVAQELAPYGSFRTASFQAWHPSERRMLITTRFGEVPQIHQVSGPGAARTQLTFFSDGVTGAASYDRSGRQMVLQKDTAGGSRAFQLFRYDFATGATTLLTDGTSLHSGAVWANRSNRIAYTSTKRTGADRDIYVMDPSDPSSSRLVLEVTGIWFVADWSPDDRELIVVEAPSTASETYLWRLNVETGEKTPLTGRDTGLVRWRVVRYTPDGRTLYALGNYKSDEPRLLRHRLGGGGEWEAVLQTDDRIETFDLSQDGRTIAAVADVGTGTELRLLDAATGKPRPVAALPPGVISAVTWHPSGQEVALTFAGARTFSDVYSVHAKTGRVERWTASEVGGANPEALPDAEIVRWKSFDGLVIPGVLYRPPARFTGPRPVIINVHGGPALREYPRGLGRSNYFRNERGVALIYPNIRGSAGFGQEYEQADNGLKREDAVKDIGALLDWIAADPALDETRVLITGGSYGGYVAYASAIQYGDRLRGAIAGFAISDFVTFLEATEPSRQADRRAEYGDPSDPAMREYLQRISPLANASKLKVPLLIVQGGKDNLVPPSQAEQMVKAVRANGTPLWYVVFEDAGHEQLTATTNNINLYTWVIFVEEFLLR